MMRAQTKEGRASPVSGINRRFTVPGAATSLFVLAAMLFSGPAHAGKYVRIDKKSGARLYYEESGSGTPVVFVPGWTMTVRYFDRQLAHFSGSKSTRFIVFDPRAHGRSSKTLDGANYVQHAHDLKIFIDELGLQDVVLGGWSWGMMTIYTYISIYGMDNIRAIVNIDQTPRPLPSGADSWADGDVSTLKGFFDTFVSDRPGTVKGFMPTQFTTALSEDELQWMAAETMLTPDIVAAVLLYDGWMFDHTQTVEQIKVPQLYFVREENAQAARAFLSRAGPDAEIVALGGHAMFYDHAPAFNEALAAFLADLP